MPHFSKENTGLSSPSCRKETEAGASDLPTVPLWVKTNLQGEVIVTSKLILVLLCVLEYSVWHKVAEDKCHEQEEFQKTGHTVVGLTRWPVVED